jgi:hypothetical protein
MNEMQFGMVLFGITAAISIGFTVYACHIHLKGPKNKKK